MEDPTTKGRHELNLASRKAEEAAWRRFQASRWLDSLVGSLGISTQPTEREFISCLRNGLVLCNVINKIQPGSVPKVVEIHLPSEVPTWDSQPLPAYQYFENVRNFLVAVEELKLPAFEASDLERDNLEVGSSAKVVDCILGLKAYHEWKQVSGGHGFFKPPRSPMVMHSASRVHSQASGAISSDPCRKLDMSTACNSFPPPESGTRNLEDYIAKAIAERMVDSKENIDDNLLISLRNGSKDPIKLFGSILSNCLGQQLQNKLPELKRIFKDLLGGVSPLAHSTSMPLGNLDNKSLLEKGKLQPLEPISDARKRTFRSQVEEMSSAALGYHKVVKENRKLYNMVQDLKGNIRVYCRIRPAFSAEARNVVDFIGEDGSLVVLDPLKPQKDGRKVFQFNRVFGPTATQEEIFKDTQPIIRSVMDGYNVCIFAYGQTGSGKTHTMVRFLSHLDSAAQSYVYFLDLLHELNVVYCQTMLKIRSCDSENGPSVPDATMHSVKSTSDVLSLMKLGEVNRVVSSTAINNQSSRSHSILTVLVHGKDVSGSTLRSCLHLVDLAGSERVAKSEVTGDGLKEAQYINKSLSYSFGETISTLKFAQRVSTVELGASRMNKESTEVKALKEQIESLKKALANKEALSGQPNEPRSPLEKQAMNERTPPRSRRLSIENCRTMEKEKPRTTPERTPPPRSRRLSIENCNTEKKEKSTMNAEEKRGTKTPSMPTRSRRLSLEGPKLPEAGSKPCEQRAPQSPTSAVCTSKVSKTDGRAKIRPLELLKTPEPPSKVARNEVQIMTSSTNGKGSQIRKSLRTIGKLINGSDKRNQQKLVEASAKTGVHHIQDARSPVSANARALRRQSLTGGIQVSRRSSLGGKSTDSCK
ncbi:hypothetical protein RHGRI_010504 [Rhododendron griersonianum]|uniref:Uncharacterized protein n=1 Tax=Rhododendron griersonianum TaxID=479676 RepID=A0AAV6KJN2_9ERIC|nr:hypothetical protein RHGRI_010504 [Rhododendron griersonianum]